MEAGDIITEKQPVIGQEKLITTFEFKTDIQPEENKPI